MFVKISKAKVKLSVFKAIDITLEENTFTHTNKQKSRKKTANITFKYSQVAKQ